MSLSRTGLYLSVRRCKRLSRRVNKLFAKLDLPTSELWVQMNHYGQAYLFGNPIDDNTTDVEFLEIIAKTPKESYYKFIDFFGRWEGADGTICEELVKKIDKLKDEIKNIPDRSGKKDYFAMFIMTLDQNRWKTVFFIWFFIGLLTFLLFR